MLKEWKSHLILQVCQEPLIVPLELDMLWRTTATNAGTLLVGSVHSAGKKFYDKDQDINKSVFLSIL